MPLNTAVIYHNKGESADECYTPYYAVDPLLEFIPKDKIIWCPFDEEWSAFYQTLKLGGYQVVRSSLAEGRDFFSYEPEQWDIMISNPPFSKKDRYYREPMNLASRLLCYFLRIVYRVRNGFRFFRTKYRCCVLMCG